MMVTATPHAVLTRRRKYADLLTGKYVYSFGACCYIMLFYMTAMISDSILLLFSFKLTEVCLNSLFILSAVIILLYWLQCV